MLTKEELRQLRQIERGLYTTDPQLAMVMSGGYRRSMRRAARRKRALVVLVDLAALAMIVLAVATGLLVLIFASSLATLLAIVLHVVRRSARPV